MWLTKTGYNREEVLLRAIQKVREFFKLPKNYMHDTITKIPLGSQLSGTFTINVDTKESSPQKISEEDIKIFLPDYTLNQLVLVCQI